MKILNATVIAGIAALTMPQSPKAAFFAIDDTSPQEIISVIANDFELGLTVNGSLLQQGLDNPVTGIYAETPGGISFTGKWIANGQVVPSSRLVAFLEPGTGGAPVVSDILSITFDNDAQGFGILTGTFISDVEGGPGLQLPTEPNLILWNESDGPYRFDNPFFNAFANSDAGDVVPDSGPGFPGLVTLVAFCGFGASRKLFGADESVSRRDMMVRPKASYRSQQGARTSGW
jgi:hypothetical protein